MPSYGTGFSLLAAVGTLSYNGVQFSALFSSKCNGVVVQDDASRTTKWVEWTLIVDGYVTLNPGEVTTDNTWTNIRQKLSEQGCTLIYQGNGFGGLIVNLPGGPVQDLAWGPIPKVLDFQTLGATGSAKIRWQVITRVPEINLSGGNGPITQFSYSATMSYDENSYSTLTIESVLEMGMTREAPHQTNIPDTIDSFREVWENITIDLNNFHVPKRDFRVSNDMRTCNAYFSATQLSPMGLPAGCISAGGNVILRPLKMGGAGPYVPAFSINWLAQMRATYIVPPNMPRRLAAEAFFLLLWFRMNCGVNNQPLPAMNNNNAAPQQPPPPPNQFGGFLQGIGATFIGGLSPVIGYNAITNQAKGANIINQPIKVPILTDLMFDEGLYNDSKQMGFSAAWTFGATFDQIISASGMWKRGPECAQWGSSMRETYGIDIAGWRGPLINALDSNVMAIVDFGHQEPLNDKQIFIPELNTNGPLGGP